MAVINVTCGREYPHVAVTVGNRTVGVRLYRKLGLEQQKRYIAGSFAG
jgi:hypothetical protein